MKRVLYTSILLLFITNHVFGQSIDTKKADKYFESLSFIKAAQTYETLLKKDTTAHILKRLGDCYYLNSRMEEASKWYGQLFAGFETDSIHSDYFFKYGQALRGTGNYKDSDKWLKKFSESRKKDARGLNFANSQNNLKNLSPEKPSFTLKNVEGINTAKSDYGANFYNGGIIYASIGKERDFVKRQHTWNDQGFLDMFSADVEGNSASNILPVKELNSAYHESSASFSPDGKTMYFTRNNYDKKLRRDSKGIANLKLYKAEWIDEKWQNITELPFNSDEYSVGHPAVSTDGKKLYFASDMSGSIGQTDIFYVAIHEDGSFGAIQTLGIHVNTEGREMFPYIVNNDLYFSSDGHFGLGGLDVFKSEYKEGDFQPPVNMKSPVNSQGDDFAFVINPERKLGYLSSNREGGKGSDDIYSFEYNEVVEVVEEKPCKQEVSGIVVDKKFGIPLSNAKIKLVKQSDGTVVSELITGVSGKFSYTLPCSETYKITASKEYYKSDSNTFKTTEAMSLELDLDFDLGIIDEFEYNDRDELMIRINPIFFDYNKSDIRTDAAVELDRIVSIMNRFPKLIIESTSHTDARGKARYNESLSDRRAKSTVRYIVSKGISEDRITGKGYGESKLTNGCVDNDAHTNRVKCTKEEHQANRRSEFLITNIAELGIAMKVAQQTKVKIQKSETKEKVEGHIVKSGETLYSIATRYGISISRLKELNNLTDNNISIGQNLKLK